MMFIVFCIVKNNRVMCSVVEWLTKQRKSAARCQDESSHYLISSVIKNKQDIVIYIHKLNLFTLHRFRSTLALFMTWRVIAAPEASGGSLHRVKGRFQLSATS